MVLLSLIRNLAALLDEDTLLSLAYALASQVVNSTVVNVIVNVDVINSIGISTLCTYYEAFRRNLVGRYTEVNK